MTVEPGFGGQAFLDVVLPKVRRARAHGRPARHAGLAAGRRRGLADTDRAAAPRPGADVFVAGSAVYGAGDPDAAVAAAPVRCRRCDRHPVGGSARRVAHFKGQYEQLACSGVGAIPNRR